MVSWLDLNLRDDAAPSSEPPSYPTIANLRPLRGPSTGGTTVSLELQNADLPQRYTSYCDPRLNYAQSLEIAFMVADYIKHGVPLSRSPSQNGTGSAHKKRRVGE